MSQAALNPANAVTLTAAAAATLGLCAPLLGGSTEATTAVMVGCVGVALGCDRVDGWLARRLGTSSETGERLDSLADLLANGALPAVIVARAGEGATSAVLVAIAYVLAAVWRLARYDGDELAATRWGPAFSGVPTPAAAGAVVVAAVFVPGLVTAVAAACAALMPSRVRYPKYGPGFWPWLVLVPLAVVTALVRAAGRG